MREEFSNINQPVIIWSNEATLSKIAIEAPDFWSWRTTVFEFRMEKVTEPLEKTEMITESGFENLTIDELNERYKQYSELLEEYKNKNIVDDHKFADWYLKLGLIHYFRGEYEEALEKYKHSMEIGKKISNQFVIASALNNIAIILMYKGEYDEALEKYREAMVIKEKLGDQRAIAYTLAQIGLLYSYMSKKEKAIESTQKALEIFEKIGLKNEARKAKAQIEKMQL
ncbi:hypothetical protein METP3_02775 [Methanosarcinales archaeon]|nr:hypothetical protein METP3_02775 [Methanosarcinales archaeon]